MPKEYDGLPIHPLVVHAVVILVPLAALVAVLFLMPRLRPIMRWPMLVLAVAAMVSTFVARQSGENLKDTLQLSGNAANLIDRHQELADQLWYIMIAFTLLVVVAWYVLPPTGTADDTPAEGTAADGRADGTTPVSVLRGVVAALVVIGAVAAGVQTYRTGEQGARAVWNPEDNVDYNAEPVS